MKKIFKTYKSTIILLTSVIIGAIIGLVFKEDAKILEPFGNLFLNFLLVSVVPLIFLSISSSIAKMNKPKRLGKIIRSMVFVFIVTSIVMVLISFFTLRQIDLIDSSDTDFIKESFDYDLVDEGTDLNIIERTVSVISVNDFSQLLTTSNMLALIIFSIMFGLSVNMAGKSGDKTRELICSLNDVVLKFLEIVMLYAPIGLGAYFAALVGTIGSVVTVGYIKTFVIYLLVSMFVYFVVYTLFAFIAAGKKGVKAFWKNVILSSATALGTCSSAASVPTNIKCTKAIGVPADIAETTISLGTSFHKDGSNIGSVFKIMFLASLFGTSVSTVGATFEILGVSLLATVLVTAIPLGGGTISEMMIISMMGYPIAALPILTIVAAVIDAPATLLNVVGDSSSSMLVARMVEGKNWLKD